MAFTLSVSHQQATCINAALQIQAAAFQETAQSVLAQMKDQETAAQGTHNVEGETESVAG